MGGWWTPARPPDQSDADERRPELPGPGGGVASETAPQRQKVWRDKQKLLFKGPPLFIYLFIYFLISQNWLRTVKRFRGNRQQL